MHSSAAAAQIAKQFRVLKMIYLLGFGGTRRDELAMISEMKSTKWGIDSSSSWLSTAILRRVSWAQLRCVYMPNCRRAGRRAFWPELGRLIQVDQPFTKVNKRIEKCVFFVGGGLCRTITRDAREGLPAVQIAFLSCFKPNRVWLFLNELGKAQQI